MTDPDSNRDERAKPVGRLARRDAARAHDRCARSCGGRRASARRDLRPRLRRARRHSRRIVLLRAGRTLRRARLRRRGSRAGRRRSSPSAASTSRCRSSSSMTLDARWPLLRTSSSSVRPSGCRSPASRGRTARRRRRICSIPSSTPQAAVPACSAPSRRASGTSVAPRCARRPKRLISSERCARCSTRATRASPWKRRLTAPSCIASTSCVSTSSSSRT